MEKKYIEKYSADEIAQFSKNVKYIMENGNISVEELSSLEGRSECVLSKNTLLRIRNYTKTNKNKWCPQEKSLLKFAEYICENFSRSITIHDLIHTDLNGVEFIRVKKQDYLKFYEGVYYCYFNRWSDGEFQRKYGLLKIFKTKDGQYSCEAVFGISHDKFFKLPSTIPSNKSLKDFHDNQENPFEFFYRGTFFFSQEAIVSHLIPDQATFMKILIFKRQESALMHFKEYPGDIIGMLTTTHPANHPTAYQPLAISKKRLNSTTDIDRFLILDNYDNKQVKNNEKQADSWIDLILKQ